MTPREYVQLIEQLEPGVRDDYLTDLARIVDSATIVEIERLLDEQNQGGIIATLGFGLSLLAMLERTRVIFLKAGVMELPAELFDPRAPGADAWLRANATDAQKRAEQGTADAIRVMVAAGVERGHTSRRIALDIVGRMNSLTGRRSGGVIGMSEAEATAIVNARKQLESPNSADKLRYLQRKSRDIRFDAIVKAAMKAGKPVNQTVIGRIEQAYAVKLLKRRVDLIARGAVLGALNAGRQEKYRQLVARGKFRADQVIKTWHSMGDIWVRDTHARTNRQKRRLNEPFTTPSGAVLMFPGDVSFGAPLSETAGCRCGQFYSVRKT